MTVTLKPWGSGDLPLLERLMGDPVMTEHLGGPENAEKLRERQARYERLEGGDRMFKIVDAESGDDLGSVGFWTREWRDEQVYEVGWSVLPEFQGQGIAVAGTRQAIELATRDEKYRFMHAFPNIDNAPSNAICGKLGFERLEALEFEYPKGHFMSCNDWRLDLHSWPRDARTRARIQEHWEASERGDVETEHAIYAADGILDYPQSGERFSGRAKIAAQRGGHPAERHFTIRRILGGGDLWVSECVITYDGAPTYSLSVMEFRDGLVTHETQYFADPFEASPGRAALAEPIPAPDQ